MSSSHKLTKKQRKSIAFRQRKGKNLPADVDDLGNDVHDVPISENLDVAETTRHIDPVSQTEPTITRVESQPVSVSSATAATKEPVNSKKRKRDTDTASVEDAKKPKKLKNKTTGDASNSEKDTEKKRENARYILFLGNLKYTTTKEAILNHFSVCDPPPQVRLLTSKSKDQTFTTKKAQSKGCAFLEFSHKNALQQGLKLHQSELDGRKINVELTAGGGGKSEKRLSKLKDRNRSLALERTKRSQKEHESHPDGADTTEQGAESGSGERPRKKIRTLARGGGGGDGSKAKGGTKGIHGNNQKQPKRRRDFGTGVNAIPVG